jgi:hypothetical protein
MVYKRAERISRYLNFAFCGKLVSVVVKSKSVKYLFQFQILISKFVKYLPGPVRPSTGESTTSINILPSSLHSPRWRWCMVQKMIEIPLSSRQCLRRGIKE